MQNYLLVRVKDVTKHSQHGVKLELETIKVIGMKDSRITSFLPRTFTYEISVRTYGILTREHEGDSLVGHTLIATVNDDERITGLE